MSDVQLTAEIGLWGYEPTPADPFVLNHRNFPSATMLGDAAMVLQTLVGGPGTVTIGCLGGAQVDRYGNVNSTQIPGGPFLVGSGGGNDVASVAAEVVVVATLTPQRTPPECGYVTSPGRAVRALVTDLGRLEKPDAGRGARAHVRCRPDPEPLAERVERARAACGWPLAGRRRSRRAAGADAPTRSRRCGAGIPAAGSFAADRSQSGRVGLRSAPLWPGSCSNT